MTLTDAAERGSRSPVWAFVAQASAIASGIIAPLVVAGLVQGLSLLREHYRAITIIRAQDGQQAQEIAALRVRTAELAAAAGRADVAAASLGAKLEAMTMQLQRIERLLERQQETRP